MLGQLGQCGIGVVQQTAGIDILGNNRTDGGLACLLKMKQPFQRRRGWPLLLSGLRIAHASSGLQGNQPADQGIDLLRWQLIKCRTEHAIGFRRIGQLGDQLCQ